MTSISLIAGASSCISGDIAAHRALDLVQVVGAALVVPIAAVWSIAVVARRNPTDTVRWTGRRMTALFGRMSTLRWAAGILIVGLIAFAASIFVPVVQTEDCTTGLGTVGALGMLFTLGGAMLLGLAFAYRVQSGWVVLATFFALDVWIVFGMVMMHIEGSPAAPDAMLMLAFIVHSVCMLLTAVWSFHARNVSTIGQVRADEAGRSIGAVWVFLAAYVVVGLFHNQSGPFDSTAGGAVLSALTLSALALTMGGGYTKYREVMEAEARGVHAATPR
ncbi:hypothetical protein [Mycolicibacterium sp. CR10]|uniref:hypothetical protein n=1 Tax=Mycolicibacterium sp. CR10 TaxID=2562314 RepID=UPI0010BF93B4|nr:hypothetical protein [Mycolicibacterium sp. CR10]